MKNIITEWLDNNQPFVIYRKPNSLKCEVWLQNSQQLYVLDELNEQLSGFVIHSFDGRNNFIFPKQKCTIKNFCVNEIHTKNPYKKTQDSEVITAKAKYEALIEKTVKSIKKSNLKKVVISRREEIDINSNLLLNYYTRLTANHPKAFVYWWFHPQIGMWMGATPEQFLKVKNNTLHTVSLAGTQLHNNNTAINETAWGTKEIAEQEIVSEFISKTLSKHTSKVKNTTPYTYKAGTLLHIKSDFEAIISTKTNLNHLIKDLHPTPALCGFPKQMAFDYITQNEGYNRSFYGGFIGEWNLDKSSDLFVNLRCMQICDNKAYLYLGGGINKDSNPTLEFLETVNKSKTIKNIL